MPESRRKGGHDYSECTFRSKVSIPLPPAIRRMIDRALRSFGPDKHVIENCWTELMPNGQTEGQYFPHTPNDICCGDAASFVLYQTGVTKLEMASPPPGLYKLRNAKGEARGRHSADFYEPTKDNQDNILLVREKSTKAQHFAKCIDKVFKPIDDNFLPGDYFLYSLPHQERQHPPNEPSHINVYLGPFVEVVDGPDGTPVEVGPEFYILNGSFGLNGLSFYVRPKDMDLGWYERNGRTIWHCRLRSIERLYKDLVRPPLEVTMDEDEPGAAIDQLWMGLNFSRTSYPIGRTLTWHDGVHLLQLGEVEKPEVMVFAPGSVVWARLAEAHRGGDTSFVLVKHHYDPSRQRILAPHPAGERAADGEEDALTLYSLYMHLAPRETYFESDGSRPRSSAPPWIKRLAPREVPAPVDFIPGGTPLSLLCFGADGELVAHELAVGRLGASLTDPVGGGAPQITVGGVSYFVCKQQPEATNKDSWSGLPPLALVPSKRRLHYLNPTTSAVVQVELDVENTVYLAQVDQKIDIVHTAADGRMYARVMEHERPAVEIPNVKTRPPAEGEEVTRDELLLEPGSKATLCLKTTSTGGTIILDAKPRVTVTAAEALARVRVRDNGRCGGKRPVDCAWLDLVPCVEITAAELQSIERALEERAASPEANTGERLERGETALFGVEISANAGWTVQDGLICPAADRIAMSDPLKRRLILYPDVTGQGKARALVNRDKDGFIDSDTSPLYAVEAAPSVKLRHVELFETKAGPKLALVEAYVAVPTSALTNNGDVIREIEEENERRRAVVQALFEGRSVDLVEAGVAPDDLIVMGEPIGEVGDIPGDLGTKGIHFQIFSGTNLVDPDEPGTDQALTQVGTQKWWILRDDASAGLFTAAFAERMTGLLRTVPIPPDDEDGDLPAEALETGVLKPEEWIDWCSGNTRRLGAVIAAHPPEWAIDWRAVLSEEQARGMPSEAEREKAATEAEAHAFLPPDTTLDGIEGAGPVYSFHPLRFIEWLSTGLDVTVTGAEDPSLTVKMAGFEDTSLVRDGDSNTFSFRTMIGQSKADAKARLVLSGVDTARRELAVKLVRGEVLRMHVVEPDVRIEPAYDQPDIDFALPVDQRLVSTSPYLLTDANAKMAGSGYSRASFLVTVSYNVAMPPSVKLKIKGAGFAISAYKVSQAKVRSERLAPGSSMPATEVALELEPEATPKAIFERPSSYTVAIDVVVDSLKPATSATLRVQVEGGDLPSALSRDSGHIKTREITRGPTDRSCAGEDVAKLQLYLSQIFCEDDQPCYRHRNKNGLFIIDGMYTKELAKALWRFIYEYSTERGWGHEDKNLIGSSLLFVDGIEVTDVKGESRRTELFAAMHSEPRPIDGPYRTKHTDRVDNPTEYPVVDWKLIKAIVSYFCVPYVLPAVKVEIGERRLPELSRHPDVKVSNDWSNSVAGRSAILPLASERVPVKVASPALPTAGGSMTFSVELPAGSAYRVLDTKGGPATTAAFTLTGDHETGLTLVYSGTMSDKQEDNVLSIKSEHGIAIARVQLTGTRDLLKKNGGGPCRDAALVQLFLSQIDDVNDPSKGACYKSTVDGKWGDRSVGALTDFKTKLAKTKDPYPALLAELELSVLSFTGPPPAPTPGLPKGGR